MLITKRENIRKQREHSERKKVNDLEKKLKAIQQSTDKQLDNNINGKIDQNVSKTVRTILSTDLTPNAFKANKKSKRTKNISPSTDGDANIAITEKENENIDERKEQAISVAS